MISEHTSESFRSDVDFALGAIVCAMRSVAKDMDDAEVLEGVGAVEENADTTESEYRSLLSAIVEVCHRYDRDGITLCASARATRAAAAAGTRPGADQGHGGDEDPRVARIVELLTASLSSAQQRRAPCTAPQGRRRRRYASGPTRPRARLLDLPPQGSWHLPALLRGVPSPQGP